MHVLYFHQHFSTPRGAAGTRSHELARRLVEAGHEVTMVCGSYAGGDTGLEGPFASGRRRGTVDGIHVLEFRLDYSNSQGLLRRTASFLGFALHSVGVAMRTDYDVVFATSTPLTAGIPGIFARWIRGKAFVFEVRDLWPELPRQMGVIRNPLVLGMMSILEWASYRSAHRCVALSPGIKSGIEKRGIPPERVAMIPNGCDLELFGSDDVAPARPASISSDQLLAIYAGTHGQANGLGAVLDAAAELKRRDRDDVAILLIGDGSEKRRLLERAKSEGLRNVTFQAPIPKVELVALLKAADLGLQCLANVPAFYYGTSPNKFFDYIATGLPVLTNYPGWLADMIDDHDCGFAVPPEDPEAFADALERAADQRSEFEVRGRRARALADNRFDRDTLAAEWIEWVIGV